VVTGVADSGQPLHPVRCVAFLLLLLLLILTSPLQCALGLEWEAVYLSIESEVPLAGSDEATLWGRVLPVMMGAAPEERSVNPWRAGLGGRIGFLRRHIVELPGWHVTEWSEEAFKTGDTPEAEDQKRFDLRNTVLRRLNRHDHRSPQRRGVATEGKATRR